MCNFREIFSKPSNYFPLLSWSSQILSSWRIKSAHIWPSLKHQPHPVVLPPVMEAAMLASFCFLKPSFLPYGLCTHSLSFSNLPLCPVSNKVNSFLALAYACSRTVMSTRPPPSHPSPTPSKVRRPGTSTPAGACHPPSSTESAT